MGGKKLAAGMLIVSAGLAGIVTLGIERTLFREPSSYINGKVIKEYGNIEQAIDENTQYEKVNYGIIVKTVDGNYTININSEDRAEDGGPQDIYSVAATIQVGTRIRFPRQPGSVINRTRADTSSGFSSSKIGMLDPDAIQILDPN